MQNELLDVKAEHISFTNENLKMLQKIEKIDWNVLNKGEMLVAKTISEFNFAIESLKDDIKVDLKNWKQNNTELEAKYEGIVLWTKMFSAINDRIKDDL
jgi:iron-sulfur cluster repair protein YtfE (RIC family)